MRYYEIDEATKDDLVVLKLAEEYYDSLIENHRKKGKQAFTIWSPARLSNNEIFYDAIGDDTWYYVFEPIEPYLDLEFRLVRSKKQSGGGFYIHDGVQLFGATFNEDDHVTHALDKPSRIIEVYFSPRGHVRTRDNGESYLSIASVIQSRKSTIIHEFVHYLDFKKIDYDKMQAGIIKRFNKEIKKGKRDTFGNRSDEYYYTSPQEFNTFFIQGISALFDETSAMRYIEDNLKRGILTLKDFISRATGKHFKKKYFRAEFIDAIYRDEKYKRKYIKRMAGLYTFLNDYVKEHGSLDLDASDEKKLINTLLRMD